MSFAKLWHTHTQACSVAFTFMTRLGRAFVVDDALLARTLAWFAPIGLFIGAVLTAPLYIWYTLSTNFFPSPLHATLEPSLASNAWLAAWWYVLLDLWLTRGLHHDGLADVTDAVGSGAQGEKFWSIMKDSRLGAFGAIALIMALSGTFFAVAQHISQGQFLPLLLAPIFARTLCVLFACISTAHNPQSLGGKVMAGKSTSKAFTHLVLAFLLCLPFGFTKTCIALILSSILCLFLRKISRLHHGANGDFLGTSIVCGQLIFLLSM